MAEGEEAQEAEEAQETRPKEKEVTEEEKDAQEAPPLEEDEEVDYGEAEGPVEGATEEDPSSLHGRPAGEGASSGD